MKGEKIKEMIHGFRCNTNGRIVLSIALLGAIAYLSTTGNAIENQGLITALMALLSGLIFPAGEVLLNGYGKVFTPTKTRR